MNSEEFQTGEDVCHSPENVYDEGNNSPAQNSEGDDDDELAAESNTESVTSDQHQTGDSEKSYAHKNIINRRVYDALNVLMAKKVPTVLNDPPTPASSDDNVSTTQSTEHKFLNVRKRKKVAEDPTTMPLCDRLFFNPPLNIFQAKEREDSSKSNDVSNLMKAPLPIAKKRRSSRTNSAASQSSRRSIDSIEVEENMLKSGDDTSEKDMSSNDQPLLVLDDSGNIVISNPGLMTVEDDKKPEIKMQSSTTYNSFRRRQRPRNTWTTEDTSIFYYALEKVGTDFSLMEAIYFKNRGRDRKQLKQKFKREEKVNREFVDKVLFKSLLNQSYQARSQLVQEHVGGETPVRIVENESTNTEEE